MEFTKDKIPGVLKEKLQIKDTDKMQQQEISQLEGIHEKAKDSCEERAFREMIIKYSDLEHDIKFLFNEFNGMIKEVTEDPEHAKQHKEEFMKMYNKKTNIMSLDEFYTAIMEKSSYSGSKMMTVYMDYYNKSRVCMEDRCKYLHRLICKGIIVEMASSAINQEEEMNEWENQFYEIQAKMQKTLNECKK
ncbi:rapunzel 2 [Silurus meridionalis]|nr:rapunzel 2 [Silurus meridionalis]